MKALECDEIFIDFSIGWEDALVVEDADHLLKPRADGNEDLHRFLSIADGVVRARGRKIIFSTKPPNVGDRDEALIRPGRSFARLSTRGLNPAQTEALLKRLCPDGEPVAATVARRLPAGKSRHSLAEIYKALAGARSDL